MGSDAQELTVTFDLDRLAGRENSVKHFGGPLVEVGVGDSHYLLLALLIRKGPQPYRAEDAQGRINLV